MIINFGFGSNRAPPGLDANSDSVLKVDVKKPLGVERLPRSLYKYSLLILIAITGAMN